MKAFFPTFYNFSGHCKFLKRKRPAGVATEGVRKGLPERSAKDALLPAVIYPKPAAESMRPAPEPILRFPHGVFESLRQGILTDTSREQFGMLLARKETAPDGREVFVILEGLIAGDDDLIASGLYQVRPKKEFIWEMLAMAQNDLAANAIIDVHTHPFSTAAHFSGVDDGDERHFSRWLADFDDRISYGSLLLSLEAWEARIWKNGQPVNASLKTQTRREYVPHVSPEKERHAKIDPMQARSALALGADVMREIAVEQLVVFAGVGGIGSVAAEMAARSGFMRIGLIDPDILELTNLNRFAGGYREDIGKPKVDVVAGHLSRINPDLQILSCKGKIEDEAAQSMLAAADWIFVSSDSHSSRQSAQMAALRYGVPLVSAGVSITVAKENGRHQVVDQSGEVIVIRHGDRFCLHCLGRINHNKVAAESNPDAAVRSGLVEKGYVQGLEEKEPAVMPLNCAIASIAVQSLLDQYRAGATHVPLTVYESHAGSKCFADLESLDSLPETCAACGRDMRK